MTSANLPALTSPPAVAAKTAPHRGAISGNPTALADAASERGNRFDRLIADYDAFRAHLPKPLCDRDAEELLHEDISAQDRTWVSGFLLKWEACERGANVCIGCGELTERPDFRYCGDCGREELDGIFSGARQ